MSFVGNNSPEHEICAQEKVYTLEEKIMKIKQIVGLDPLDPPTEGDIEINEWKDVLKIVPQMCVIVEKMIEGKDHEEISKNIREGNFDLSDLISGREELFEKEIEAAMSRIKFTKDL